MTHLVAVSAPEHLMAANPGMLITSNLRSRAFLLPGVLTSSSGRPQLHGGACTFQLLQNITPPTQKLVASASDHVEPQAAQPRFWDGSKKALET